MSNTKTDKALPVSLDSLSDLLGINASEFSTLFEEKDGEKVPVNQSAIDTFVKDRFKKKVDSLLEDSGSDKIKEARDRARKEVYQEIEDEAKKEGITMHWSNDKLAKIKEHYLEESKMNPDDVKKSDIFIQAMKEKVDEINVLKEQHAQEIRTRHQNQVKTKFVDHLLTEFTKEGSKLQVPADPNIARNLIEMMVTSKMMDEDNRVDIVDDKFVILGKDGKPKKDEKTYNVVDVDKYAYNVARQSFFPEITPDKIDAPDPSKETGEKIKIKEGEKVQEYDVPVFKTEDELSTWLTDAITEGVPTAVIEKANENFYSKTEN